MAQLFIPKTAIFKEGGGEPIVEGSVYAYMPTQEPQYSLFILVGKNSGSDSGHSWWWDADVYNLRLSIAAQEPEPETVNMGLSRALYEHTNRRKSAFLVVKRSLWTRPRKSLQRRQCPRLNIQGDDWEKRYHFTLYVHRRGFNTHYRIIRDHLNGHGCSIQKASCAISAPYCAPLLVRSTHMTS